MALIEVLQKRDVLCPSCISLDIEDVCFGRRPNDEITDCTACKVEDTLHLMIVLQAGSISNTGPLSTPHTSEGKYPRILHGIQDL